MYRLSAFERRVPQEPALVLREGGDVSAKACQAIREGGEQCRSAPLRDEPYCFWHSPDHQEEATEARRLGGQRRRRERVVSGVYDFEGLDSVPKIRRLVEIAALDTLGLENSVNRARTLVSLATVAARLLEVGELETRVDALEAATGPRLLKGGRS